MIRLDQLRILIPEEVSEKAGDREDGLKITLIKKAASALGIRPWDIDDIRIVRHSIDARKKPVLYDVYSVNIRVTQGVDEKKVLKRAGKNARSVSGKDSFLFPYECGGISDDERPVIIGSGPAGMFCAYELALHGYRPIVLERGSDVDERTRKVENFWKTGRLDEECNVQFGEGGAGTFSDGKLTTGVKDRLGLTDEVLKVFAEHGAPGDILYEAYPHIGTDVLKSVVKNIRDDLIRLGGEVRFNTRADRLVFENEGAPGRRTVRGVELADGSTIRTGTVVLAIGHSARDTFRQLYSQGIVMSAKPFAVGVRVEHPQELIDMSQYGRKSGIPGPAPYKLACTTPEGRAVYTFCMCPGGMVVNASSEKGYLAVNGMSLRSRGGRMANSAVIAAVSPEEYGDGSALSGLEFQRKLEKRAFEEGSGRIPVQRYRDFRRKILKGAAEEVSPGGDISFGEETPDIRGEWTYADVNSIFPEPIAYSLACGIDAFGRQIGGFDSGDTFLIGVESRTSSPVRIERDDTLMAEGTYGLYPCGEGAGYAGGITSAAMDGIRVALKIGQRFADSQ